MKKSPLYNQLSLEGKEIFDAITGHYFLVDKQLSTGIGIGIGILGIAIGGSLFAIAQSRAESTATNAARNWLNKDSSVSDLVNQIKAKRDEAEDIVGSQPINVLSSISDIEHEMLDMSVIQDSYVTDIATCLHHIREFAWSSFNNGSAIGSPYESEFNKQNRKVTEIIRTLQTTAMSHDEQHASGH